ncbi:DUF4398 domain-containing protein [bacterium]|nr:DUF4398 domain-containing protein [bacterium]
MTRIILGVICFCVALIIIACSGANKFAANIIDDTRTQIVSAEQIGAKQTAFDELRDAENLLAEAETVLDKGDDDEAYRIGTKAYLTARYAEALAAKRRAELDATVAELELREAQQSEEVARRDREQAEKELSALME